MWQNSRRPAILLLEDDDGARGALMRLMQRRAPSAQVVPTTSLAAAHGALAKSLSWVCLVLDYHLPDGNGLDFLEEVRALRVDAPAIILTGSVESRLINRAFSLHATYVCKPDAHLVARFVEESLEAHDALSVRIAAAVTEIAKRHKLTAAETVLLESAVRGMSRDEFVADRDITQNTYKTQAKNILAKTHHAAISSLCNEILRGLIRR